tara:strand:- start:1009 stop:1785 length:777 start_codon:yes stop_codon:yes gene_type:complete
MTNSPLHLRSIACTGRLALTLLLLVVLGGFGASAAYLVTHHENRDEQPGFTMDDVRGHYHGVRTGSSLVAALERNHPAEIEGATALPEAQRSALLAWLAGDRLSETFDDLDLGDDAPAEVLAVSCLDCHARASENAIGKTLPLEYWDDVEPLASSRTIEPVDTKILLASTHTHALALGTTALLVVLLMLLTRWPARLRNGLALLASLGLFVDLGAWWIARDVGSVIPVIVVGGTLFITSTCLMLTLVIADLWLPQRRA